MDLFAKVPTFTRAKDLQAAGLYPYFLPIQSATGPEVTIDGRQVIMVGSNNYLGLTQHPKVKEAAIRAVEKYGSGCTGSRFLNGTIDLHQELEGRLARFAHKEATVLFSTGFQTNLGVISSIVGKDDIILSDRGNHASIVDGCRLSFGKTLKYRHGDMEDLEGLLQQVSGKAGVLIVTDGVFSMEGDLAELPRIVELKKKYGARLMVDDAHGIGVMGANGRGTAEHFGVEEDVDLIMGTFSKSFASLGGYIGGRADVIHYIQHTARELIFSASMPPSAVAVALAALDIIETEPERRATLWRNVRKMKKAFLDLGLDIGSTASSVIPFVVGDDLKVFHVWRSLFESGVFTNPVVAPAVEPGQGLLRTSYMATHTEEILDRVIEIVRRVGNEMALFRTERAKAPAAQQAGPARR